MEIPYCKMTWAGQVLVVWLPMVLASCREDINVLPMTGIQKFIHTKEDMRASCSDLIDRNTDECSLECEDKVQKMVDLYEGSLVLFTCDCSDTLLIYSESECFEIQERLAVCPNLQSGSPAQTTSARARTAPASTTPTILQDGRVPCDAAHRRCSKNSNCVSQLQTTVATCEGPGCDLVCQRALDTLLAQRDAQDLWECTGCDEGHDDDWCDLSKRCTAAQGMTVVPYKVEGTTKTSDGKENGRADKSTSPKNTARPLCSFHLSLVELLIVSVILRIAFS